MAGPRHSRQEEENETARTVSVFDDRYEVQMSDDELYDLYGAPSPLPRGPTQPPERPSIQTRPRSRTPTRRQSERKSGSNGEETERSPPRRWRSSIAKEPLDNQGRSGRSAEGPVPSSTRPLSRFSTASSYAPFEERSHTPVNGRSASGHTRAYGSRDSSASQRRPSLGASGRPAHPYGLYNQTSLPGEDGVEPIEPVPAIPVGFMGRTNEYHRQIGPDGEEQDIIGPDGHTESLPPYSRYPDGDAKTLAVAAAPAAPSSRRRSTRSRARSSRHSSRHLSSNVLLDRPAQPESSDTSARSVKSSFIDEKSWSEKTFKEKSRTRVCGGCIPLWGLLTIVACLIMIPGIVGGVVGGLLAAEKKGRGPKPPRGMLDASPIPAPANFVPMPTGVFAMPLGIPQEQIKSCLTEQEQWDTWTCNTPSQPLYIDVGRSPLSDPMMYIHRTSNDGFNSNGASTPYNFSWGAQYPSLVMPETLNWVLDLEEPNRGPALHFQTVYDKIVVVKADQFENQMKMKSKRDDDDDDDDLPFVASGAPAIPSSSSSSSSRTRSSSSSAAALITEVAPPPPPPTGTPFSFPSASSAAASSTAASEPNFPPDGPQHRKEKLVTGDQPWFCFWNQTWLEGFIYVDTYVPTSSFDPSVSDGSASTSASASPNRRRDALLADADSNTARNVYRRAMIDYAKRQPSGTPTVMSSSNADASMAAAEFSPDPTASPSPFPYIMKVQERRIPDLVDSVKPYCQKMYVPEEGPPVPVLNYDGKPIVVEIDEDPDDLEDQSDAIRSGRTDMRRMLRRSLGMFSKRDEEMRSCHCMWVSPPPPNG